LLGLLGLGGALGGLGVRHVRHRDGEATAPLRAAPRPRRATTLRGTRLTLDWAVKFADADTCRQTLGSDSGAARTGRARACIPGGRRSAPPITKGSHPCPTAPTAGS